MYRCFFLFVSLFYYSFFIYFFFQAEDGIRDGRVTGVQTCALPIYPGIDDALALLLALRSPELDVRGISVSYGNTVVEHAHRNALELLRRTGRRLPVAVGARRPLKRGLAVALETHGPSGLGYAAVPPAGSTLDFVKPLDRLLADQPAPVTLVTLGPLTSLALALRR